jgi:hypothetical protein
MECEKRSATVSLRGKLDLRLSLAGTDDFLFQRSHLLKFRPRQDQLCIADATEAMAFGPQTLRRSTAARTHLNYALALYDATEHRRALTLVLALPVTRPAESWNVVVRP